MGRREFFAIALAAARWKKAPPKEFLAELPEMMAVAPVPGASIALLESGKVAWSGGFGVSNADTKQPVAADTVFESASLSKPVVAMAALGLRDEGKLDLDRPLSAYLPIVEDARAKLVTARHVLSHSSGFPNWRFKAGEPLTPAFQPGERFQYSNEGFVYLQRVIEEITGQAFGDFMEARALGPLGMTSSSFTWTAELAPRVASPHGRRGGVIESPAKRERAGLLERAGAQNRKTSSFRYAEHEALLREIGERVMPVNVITNAAASLLTTPADYARFLIAAMRKSETHAEQVKIRESLAWGLGWGLERAGGRRYLWHWGDNTGFKNFVLAEAATGFGVIVFTNGDLGMRLCERVVTRATGQEHPAFLWI